MSTSNSWDSSATALDIITTALEDIGKLGEGEVISVLAKATMLRRLNYLAKQWQGRADFAPGLKVSTRQRVTLFLAKNQSVYTIGPAATDSRATTSYGRTTISTAEAIGQTTISITSNTDVLTSPDVMVTMAAADIVGIELDDGTLQWTTISGTPASTMDIAVALTGAAAAGNYVYWFTVRAQHFPVIEYAALRDEDGNDLPIDVLRTVQSYEASGNKNGTGDPASILVEPLALSTRITLDTLPQDVTKQLRLTVLYPAEDYDAVTDDIAFPQEWYAPLAAELGKRSCGAYGATWTQTMEENRKESLAIARSVNPEVSNAFFETGGL